MTPVPAAHLGRMHLKRHRREIVHSPTHQSIKILNSLTEKHMKLIIGRKFGMTRVFNEDGKSIATSIVKVLPCEIAQIKTMEKDKYSAIRIEAKNEKGRAIKNAEIRVDSAEGLKKGDKVELSQFEKGEKVAVSGTSKGKGFAGTIKRHGFQRGPESHGGNNVREPGSIGAQQPQRVVLGRRMAGKMGAETVTVANLEIISIDGDMVLISGAIPGPIKGIVTITSKQGAE